MSLWKIPTTLVTLDEAVEMFQLPALNREPVETPFGTFERSQFVSRGEEGFWQESNRASIRDRIEAAGLNGELNRLPSDHFRRADVISWARSTEPFFRLTRKAAEDAKRLCPGLFKPSEPEPPPEPEHISLASFLDRWEREAPFLWLAVEAYLTWFHDRPKDGPGRADVRDRIAQATRPDSSEQIGDEVAEWILRALEPRLSLPALDPALLDQDIALVVQVWHRCRKGDFAGMSTLDVAKALQAEGLGSNFADHVLALTHPKSADGRRSQARRSGSEKPR